MWALWPLDNEETRLFLELDFPEGRGVVLARTGQEAAARYICMRESWAELTRADQQQDNSAGDTGTGGRANELFKYSDIE